MKLTAKKLLAYLRELEDTGHDLSSISVNYRNNYDSDVKVCNHVEEDLYDAETNSKLKSIILLNKQNE